MSHRAQDGKSIHIWVVSDGRRGIENQALGLAEAIGDLTPATHERRIAPRPGPLDALTGPLRRAPPATSFAHPPDLWIGCGRAALRQAQADRRQFPEARFVFVQDPKRDHGLFDLIIPPQHDALTGDGVLSILGSPNRITPGVLAEAREQFCAQLDALPPAPRAAVLIGGVSKRHRLTPALAANLIDDLIGLRNQAGLMISTSRRTPPAVKAGLRSAFGAAEDVWLWTGDEDGPNPYFAFLAGADVALVTKDSTNMLTEAASAGLPVLMIEMAGKDGKFTALYEALIEGQHARWFHGALETWAPPGLNETSRAAHGVLAVMNR